MVTLTGLVLGLLINSANNFSNTQKAGLEMLSTRAIQLDQALAEYGPEARPGRDLLRAAVVEGYDLRFWRKHGQETTPLDVGEAPTHVKSIAEFLATLWQADKRCAEAASDPSPSI